MSNVYTQSLRDAAFHASQTRMALTRAPKHAPGEQASTVKQALAATIGVQRWCRAVAHRAERGQKRAAR